MSENWNPGDLALCVDTPQHCTLGTLHPCRPGGIYTVERVVLAADGELGLGLVGIVFPNTKLNADSAAHYRRIAPHTADTEDEYTVFLLTGAPMRETADG